MAAIRLLKVRLSFPQLFTATEYEAGDGRPRYAAAFLVDPGSAADKAIKAGMLAVANDKWGAKGPDILAKALKGDNRDVCYYDGNKKEYDGYAGKMALSTSRPKKDGRPGVYDRDTSPLTEEDGKIYAGCYVNAMVSFWPQDNKNGKTIRCTVIGVQFDSDGDAFSSAVMPDANAFESLDSGADADDLV